MPRAVPSNRRRWIPELRLIASRYPTVGVYDRDRRPADLDVVFAIEGLTNPRIRNEIGQLTAGATRGAEFSGAGSQR